MTNSKWSIGPNPAACTSGGQRWKTNRTGAISVPYKSPPWVAAYSMLLAMVLDILGLHEAAAALREDRRAWQERRTAMSSA